MLIDMEYSLSGLKMGWWGLKGASEVMADFPTEGSVFTFKVPEMMDRNNAQP